MTYPSFYTVSAAVVLPNVTPKTILLRVPTGMVLSNLTNFPVRVDLSHMPESFWLNVKADGGDVRAKTTGGTVIPHDLVWIDKVNRRGELYFLAATLNTGSNNDFHITCGDNSLSELPATDGNGRNAVWAAYSRVFHFVENVDRTGSGVTATITNNQTGMLALAEVIPGRASHQGVEYRDDDTLYLFDTNIIRKVDRNGVTIAVQQDIATATGLSGFTHSGDGCYVSSSGKLYTPGTSATKSWIVEWNPDTLAFVQAFEITATQGTSAASIAYNPADGLLYVCKYGSAATTLTIFGYDPADGSNDANITLSSGTTNMQGITFWNSKLYVGSDTDPYQIKRYALNGTFEQIVFRTAINDNNASADNLEGLSHDANGLYVLVDPEELSHSTVLYLRLVDEIHHGALQFVGTGSADITVPKLTQWTIGLRTAFTDHSANVTFAEYGGGGNGERLVGHSANFNMAIWNTTDGFSDSAYLLYDAFLFNHWYHNSTTERELWTNGVLGVNDATVAAMPAGTGTTIRLGQNLSNTEPVYGHINYMYLYNGEVPDDFKRAEAVNHQRPEYFYRLTDDGGGLVFPYIVDIVNPGAETNSTTGWTNLSGALFAIQSGVGAFNSGAHGMTMAASTASVWWGQTVALPSGMNTDIDTGTLEIEWSGYFQGFTDADMAQFMMDFYDGSSVYIGSASSPEIDTANMKKMQVRSFLPKNTRNVRVSVRGRRVTGTENSTYMDDFQLRIFKPGKVANLVTLFSMEAGSATGWTADTGSLGTSTARFGETVLSGGSNASTTAHRDISLSSLSTEIAAGKVTCHMIGQLSNVNDDDTMNFSLQYLDGSNVAIGSALKFTLTSTGFNPGLAVVPVHLVRAAPTNAASLRVGLEYSRVDGTVLDAGVCRMSVLAAVSP